MNGKEWAIISAVNLYLAIRVALVTCFHITLLFDGSYLIKLIMNTIFFFKQVQHKDAVYAFSYKSYTIRPGYVIKRRNRADLISCCFKTARTGLVSIIV